MNTQSLPKAPSSSRVVWVDTLKAIGMFSIYVGHFLSITGLSYAFIFAYGVQVFFFASGFFAVPKTEALQKNAALPGSSVDTGADANAVKTGHGLLRSLCRRVRTLLVPYVCFSALALIVISLQSNYGLEEVLPLVKQSVLGMRNQTPAIALWFLPALFIMQVLYDVLYRLFGTLPYKKLCIFIISMVVFILVAIYVDPIGQPKWFFSLDSALYFFPFYAAGPLVYPLLCFSFKDCSAAKKCALSALALAILGITAAIYFAKMLPFYQLCKDIPLFPTLYPFFTACVLIGFLYMLARALCGFSLLAAMGRDTLYFCGSETVIKIILPELLSLGGLTLTLTDPLSVYLYGAALMLVCYFVLIPVEKKLFGGLFR